MPLLKEWESFYVIVGSAAAALTGLQFVATALIADIDVEASSGTFDAFATPTIVHFSGALLISAILSAPWESPMLLGALIAIAGAAGIAYCGLVARRSRQQTEYQPVFEDWLFHVALPVIAYAGFGVAGYLLWRSAAASGLVVVAAAILLLLAIGIHNTWDTVTYLIVVRRHDHNSPDHPTSAPTTPE